MATSMNEEIKTWLNDIFKDPVTLILLKYSNLTRIQFESILIDLASDNASVNLLRYEDKAKIRSKEVSRGSYNRSLKQARNNIISSIYTILLFSYVGLFIGPVFEDYENLAEKLREYMSLYKSYINSPRTQKDLLLNIEKELLDGIERLAKPKVLKST